jgi:hypothetical protein
VGNHPRRTRPCDGKRRRKWHSFTGTKRAAQIECARLIAEMRGGRYSEPSKLTVGQFFETWLSHVKPQVTPRTTSAIVNSFGKTSFPQSARSV